jgi:hypothetical protein
MKGYRRINSSELTSLQRFNFVHGRCNCRAKNSFTQKGNYVYFFHNKRDCNVYGGEYVITVEIPEKNIVERGYGTYGDFGVEEFIVKKYGIEEVVDIENAYEVEELMGRNELWKRL